MAFSAPNSTANLLVVPKRLNTSCNYPVLPTLAKNPLFMSEESGNPPPFIHPIAHDRIVGVVSATQC